MSRAKSVRKEFQLKVGDDTVSAIYDIPNGCKIILVFAHGAGAGMDNSFMETMSSLLADQNIGTCRFNFPYKEKGSRAPNAQPILLKTIEVAVQRVVGDFPDHTVFAGGKSMGGRMSSIAMSKGMLEEVKGLVFFGFPLHAPGGDSLDRAKHLHEVQIPMLFLQGTRDKLANLDLMQELSGKLGTSATLKIFEGADHSFKTRKKDPLSTDETIQEVANTAAEWMSYQVSGMRDEG